MYMPIWGTVLILSLCLLVLWTAGNKFIEMFIHNSPNKHPIRIYFSLLSLLILIVLSVVLGYEAIAFNRKYGEA